MMRRFPGEKMFMSQQIGRDRVSLRLAILHVLEIPMIKSASLMSAALLVFGLAAGSMAADIPDAPRTVHKHSSHKVHHHKAQKSHRAKKIARTDK
jgi:hypothetical protein